MDDSDEDWKAATKKKRGAAKKSGDGGASGAKGRGGGYTKAVKLSPELSDIVGSESMPRHEVVKKMWSIIKERNLYVRDIQLYIKKCFKFGVEGSILNIYFLFLA